VVKESHITIQEARNRAFLTISEFGAISGLGSPAAYRYCKMGLIPSVEIGFRKFVPRSYFAEYLDDAKEAEL